MPGIGFELPVDLSLLAYHRWAIKGLSERGRLIGPPAGSGRLTGPGSREAEQELN